MPDMADGSSTRPPQISEMFQKFAISFKTKAFEFFAEEDGNNNEETDGFTLLDSAEDFIPHQKVIILKPDRPIHQNQDSPESTSRFSSSSVNSGIGHADTQTTHALISSVFAAVSSFEASYLQLQTSHVPFNEEGIKVSDSALVSNLQRLSDLKQFYREICRNPEFGAELPIGSHLEAQVQENQSKLRILGTVSNRLQEEIDKKDNDVLASRRKLSEIQKFNLKLSKRLSGNLNNSSCEVLCSVRVFDSVLHDVCKASHKFTEVLIDLMRKSGWDLDLASNSVHSGVEFARKGDRKYAFLSYLCLRMFRGFDLEGFGLGDEYQEVCNGHISDSVRTNSSLKQLLEHVSSNPMELLSNHPTCVFSKFCERKYQEIIHPTMESSIFSNLDQNEIVLNSLSIFYEFFVNMASSIWILHKLAFLFEPVVEIFQVKRGVDFSMIYMEDVTRKCALSGKARAKVGFTVVPGFKIGRTVIQSQVYLRGLNCTE
ncbi:hypothetical protein HS088_TW18G00328 [Tripterygium wilfordii]|uniref:DUF641 domain-containing protein n=1 Tax=Tripterygium wilfordii TaxID=458696 RepID=A0A7J7CCI2_TRIWF|nr:protein GRAVITROPIC IN THE LIGHT 1-like [Tripterygium wilfordii]KAF5731645.1 hypothetical protein HS088_TW18G00328 [Tripterygium wilfordii]